MKSWLLHALERPLAACASDCGRPLDVVHNVQLLIWLALFVQDVIKVTTAQHVDDVCTFDFHAFRHALPWRLLALPVPEVADSFCTNGKLSWGKLGYACEPRCDGPAEAAAVAQQFVVAAIRAQLHSSAAERRVCGMLSSTRHGRLVCQALCESGQPWLLRALVRFKRVRVVQAMARGAPPEFACVQLELLQHARQLKTHRKLVEWLQARCSAA